MPGAACPWTKSRSPLVVSVSIAEEVVESDHVERRGRRVGGDMPAYGAVGPVGPNHHGQRVPAYDVLDAAFQVPVTRIGSLQLDGYRIDVGRVGGEREAHAGLGGPGLQRRENAACSFRVALRNDVLNRFEPFMKFQRFYIGFKIRCHQVAPGYFPRWHKAFFTVRKHRLKIRAWRPSCQSLYSYGRAPGMPCRNVQTALKKETTEYGRKV